MKTLFFQDTGFQLGKFNLKVRYTKHYCNCEFCEECGTNLEIVEESIDWFYEKKPLFDFLPKIPIQTSNWRTIDASND